MAISEAQLTTWSAQGSITQSSDTYATVRGVLNDPKSPYHAKSYQIFLQGSYGNDTNIFADSDVDVVIGLDSTYYYDLNNLDEAAKIAFNSNFVGASYGYANFKNEVLAWLIGKYGTAVKAGTKAIRIDGNGSRRDADVLPCVSYRRYTGFKSANEQSYIEGICFWMTDGTQIINYPKQHSENMTTKHQASAAWLKPTVRIFKNMRNTMIKDGLLEEGLAPSYFIEGMLYNLPKDNFGGSYVRTVSNALVWLQGCDREKLLCANEQYLLLHPSSPVTWRTEKFEIFLGSTIQYWNNWG